MRGYLSERDKDNARLKNNLKLIENGRGCRAMAQIVGTSPTTYSRKRKRPESFTLFEIERLCRNAKVSVSDFCGLTLQIGGGNNGI